MNNRHFCYMRTFFWRCLYCHVKLDCNYPPLVATRRLFALVTIGVDFLLLMKRRIGPVPISGDGAVHVLST